MTATILPASGPSHEGLTQQPSDPSSKSSQDVPSCDILSSYIGANKDSYSLEYFLTMLIKDADYI